MAVVTPIIVQVVGFQNSGKTTFVKKLLQELSKQNIYVATIKHHGHGGKPDVVEKKGLFGAYTFWCLCLNS